MVSVSVQIWIVAVVNRLCTFIIKCDRETESSVFSRSGDDQLVCVSVPTPVSPSFGTRSATSARSINIIATVNHRPQQPYPSLRESIYKRAELSSKLTTDLMTMESVHCDHTPDLAELIPEHLTGDRHLLEEGCSTVTPCTAGHVTTAVIRPSVIGLKIWRPVTSTTTVETMTATDPSVSPMRWGGRTRRARGGSSD